MFRGIIAVCNLRTVQIARIYSMGKRRCFFNVKAGVLIYSRQCFVKYLINCKVHKNLVEKTHPVIYNSLYYIKNQQDGTLAVLFISHCKITLHVSDAFCVHHQECKNCSSSHWCMSWVGVMYIHSMLYKESTRCNFGSIVY